MMPSTVVIPVSSEMRLMCLRYTESVLADLGAPVAVVCLNVSGNVNGIFTEHIDFISVSLFTTSNKKTDGATIRIVNIYGYGPYR